MAGVLGLNFVVGGRLQEKTDESVCSSSSWGFIMEIQRGSKRKLLAVLKASGPHFAHLQT